MYDLLAAMYRQGQIDKTGLDKAVTFGWITADQEQQIIDADGNVGVLVVAADTTPAP
jgi:hypothetical protein